MRIRKTVYDAICRHALEAYPSECCGFLAAPDPEEAVTESIACANAQDRLHEEDPSRFPRTSREAFYIDGADLFNVYRLMAEREYHIAGVYHSHIETGAFFSDEDRRFAVVNGEPVWPDARYLVLSVSRGILVQVCCHVWSRERADFIEESIAVESAESA